MRIINGFLDGMPVSVNVTETLEEYREGARLLNRALNNSEGILFNFRNSNKIVMENSGVEEDLSILYFHKFTKYGIVQDVKELKANCADPITSNGSYELALEMKKSFCKSNNIKKGSILILKEEIK